MRANLIWLFAVAAAGVGGYLLGGLRDAEPERRAERRPAPAVEPSRTARRDSDEKRDDPREAEQPRAGGSDATPPKGVETRETMPAPPDDLRDVLLDLGHRRVRLPSAVADRETFTELFRQPAEGPLLDGAAAPKPEGGATIRYPAGVFPLESARFKGLGDAPLVIEGAGMDATLLRLKGSAIDFRVGVLTIRDVTIDCNERYLTDYGSPRPFTMRLERVRVVGFDSGVGRSVMFKVRHGALYATDCRFEAGYGRAPGSGTLFRVNQALLVRLEHCVIRGPFARLFDVDSGATYYMLRCGLEEMDKGADRAPPGVTFADCRFDFRAEGARPERRMFRGEWQRPSRK